MNAIATSVAYVGSLNTGFFRGCQTEPVKEIKKPKLKDGEYPITVNQVVPKGQTFVAEYVRTNITIKNGAFIGSANFIINDTSVDPSTPREYNIVIEANNDGTTTVIPHGNHQISEPQEAKKRLISYLEAMINKNGSSSQNQAVLQAVLDKAIKQ
ncbi:MAG: hypothetical protein ABIH50_04095 [bacterium]